MLGPAWGIWASDHPVEVLLRFTPRVAARVIATTWHESQRLRELADGGVELRLVIAEPTEIRPWILGWGQECEVIAPIDLRESILSELVAAASLYGKPAAQVGAADGTTVHLPAARERRSVAG